MKNTWNIIEYNTEWYIILCGGKRPLDDRLTSSLKNLGLTLGHEVLETQHITHYAIIVLSNFIILKYSCIF